MTEIPSGDGGSRMDAVNPTYAVNPTVNRGVGGGYLMVLAIDAPHVAAGEKDVANSLRSADGRLLALMDTHRCNTE